MENQQGQPNMLINEEISRSSCVKPDNYWHTSDQRIGRLRYIIYSMLTFILSRMTSPLGDFGEILAAIGLTVVYIILVIKRVHDFNASGWWAVIFLIPIINFALWFIPGIKGENRFGKQTPPNTYGEKIAVILTAIIWVFLLALAASK